MTKAAVSSVGAKKSWGRWARAWLRLVAKSSNECSQYGRRLPPTGVIEVVAGEGRAPLLQNPRETPGRDVSQHLILIHICKALAGQGCLSDQVGVIENEGPVNPNF